MSRYGNETPMDFEWNNGTGAVDGRSPFAQVSSNAQRFPPGSSVKKGSYGSSQLSPSKTRTQPSSPNKALPPVPAFNALFSTPRKPRPEIDDSSAGETPKSPERGADGESDATPEVVRMRTAMSKFDGASTPARAGAERRVSPVKEKERERLPERPQADRRDSLLGRLVSKAKNKIYSPGRGEFPRSEHTGAIEKRTKTKRRRDVDRRVARQRRQSLSDSESEAPATRRRSPRKRSGHKPPPSDDEDTPHWMSKLFTFIGAHPSVPHILSYYAQFLFNVFLLSCVGYLIYCFWGAIQADVDNKAYEAMGDIVADIAGCERDFHLNNCNDPVPAVRQACAAWAKCKAQDPLRVGRARVGAGTFAGIFNEFVEGISWKAMVFTAVIVFGSFGMSNFAFGFFRQRAEQYQPPSYGYNNPPPPTPQRAFSGQEGSFYAGTPWHVPPQGMGLEPQPSGSYGQIEGQGSPVRRLAYN